MALLHRCMRWCAHIVLDFADIVRDGDISPTIDGEYRQGKRMYNRAVHESKKRKSRLHGVPI